MPVIDLNPYAPINNFINFVICPNTQPFLCLQNLVLVLNLSIIYLLFINNYLKNFLIKISISSFT